MTKVLGLAAILALQLTAQDPNAEAIRKKARELERALIAADTAAMQQMLTDDFLRTPPGGQDTDKAQYTSLIATGRLKYIAFDNLQEKVRAYANTVLINDLTDLRYRGATGPERSIRLKLLWVWVKQDGEWRLAAVQGNQVSAQ